MDSHRNPAHSIFYPTLLLFGHLRRIAPLPQQSRHIPDTVPPPVSIVVVVRENAYYFIENTLPLLLAQQYHQFEVVVVDCSYDDEISLQLNEMSMQYPHLKLTRINPQPNYEHSNKLALTVGIKAATYEHLLFTTIDCYPTSQRWLSIMAKGFICGDVVIGYCNLEIKKALPTDSSAAIG